MAQETLEQPFNPYSSPRHHVTTSQHHHVQAPFPARREAAGGPGAGTECPKSPPSTYWSHFYFLHKHRVFSCCFYGALCPDVLC